MSEVRPVKRIGIGKLPWTSSSGVILLALVIVPQAVAGPVTFNTNLIDNPGAEANLGQPVNGWTMTGNFTVVAYGEPTFPTLADPGPPDRGNHFFAGGSSNTYSTIAQMIDLSGLAGTLDLGGASYILSGWLGGYIDQDDNAILSASFLSASSSILATAFIGPVLAADRNNQTGLWFRSTSGTVPSGTRSVELLLQMTRTHGGYNDGFADNLSLVLQPPADTPEPSQLIPLLSAIALGAAWRRWLRRPT